MQFRRIMFESPNVRLFSAFPFIDDDEMQLWDTIWETLQVDLGHAVQALVIGEPRHVNVQLSIPYTLYRMVSDEMKSQNYQSGKDYLLFGIWDSLLHVARDFRGDWINGGPQLVEPHTLAAFMPTVRDPRLPI